MSRDKKVLFLCTGVFANGGIQRFNRTLLAACGEIDVPSDVFSLMDDESAPRQFEAPANATVTMFGGNKARFALAVARALITGRYEYVLVGHINYLQLAVASLKFRPFGVPRVLLLTHGIEVWSGIRGGRRRALSALDRILCVSSFTQQMIQQQAPELGESRFGRFPNALGEAWSNRWARVMHGAEATADTRPTRLPERFILSVARLDRDDRTKGIFTVIEALSMLEARDTHYVIAGHGNDMEFLRQVAERHGVAERVHLVGSVKDEELVDLYRHCSAFVLPSGQEGFGIVFLEAMYFGAVVVAARAKGAVDVVQDAETGLLVEYGNVMQLRAAIDRLLADRALCATLRERARATVTDDGVFGFRAFTRRTATLFD